MGYEGDRFRPYLFRFATLMALAAVIAVLGVVPDSAALVIGAMLLAPLMTPVLALAAALTMIWPRRLSRVARWVGWPWRSPPPWSRWCYWRYRLPGELRLASEESRVSAVVIEEVATWAGRDTRVTSIDVGLDSVLIALEGPVQPPEVDPLGGRLRERLADDLELSGCGGWR